MPIYEYECEKCGAVFEMMQSISAKPLKKCQGAGCNNKDNGKVRRLVSATGFILKGSGWYTSDYPSEARKQGWEAESKHANSASAGADAAPKSEAASTAVPDTPKTTEPKPIEKKPAQKNPYSGRGGKKVKTGK